MSEWGEVLKPEFFAPVLFGQAPLSHCLQRAIRKRKALKFLIGFALLFIGLSFMSGAIKPYRDARFSQKRSVFLGRIRFSAF